MYKIPDTSNYNFLFKNEIEEVCIGSYGVRLNLTSDISMYIQSVIVLTDISNLASTLECDNPDLTKNLVCLLKSKIIDAYHNENIDLTITFSNGYKIMILNDDYYEAYTITGPDQDIII